MAKYGEYDDKALSERYPDWKGVDWVNPHIEFPRLLAEIWHTGSIPDEKLKEISIEMGLPETAIIEIFERALREVDKNNSKIRLCE